MAISLCHYQRVIIPLNPIKPPLSYGFSMVFLWFLWCFARSFIATSWRTGSGPMAAAWGSRDQRSCCGTRWVIWWKTHWGPLEGTYLCVTFVWLSHDVIYWWFWTLFLVKKLVIFRSILSVCQHMCLFSWSCQKMGYISTSGEKSSFNGKMAVSYFQTFSTSTIIVDPTIWMESVNQSPVMWWSVPSY